MTNTIGSQELPMSELDESGENGPRFSAAEVEAFQRDWTFADDEHSTPEMYPRLTNMSAGFLKRAIIRPVSPETPEYVTVDLSAASRDDEIKKSVAIAEWNMLWESAQFRRRFFDDDDLTPDLMAIAERGDQNIVLVPRTRTRYHEYAPLFHLIKRGTLERFGLPLLRAGQWPFVAQTHDMSTYLPDDFEQRLALAWGSTVWRHLNSGSPVSAFSLDDPIRLLAHNLDFWVPPVAEVIEQTLREFPLVAPDEDAGDLPTDVRLSDGSILEGAVPGWPRKGGDIWTGEEMAGWAVEDVIEQADGTGQLRGIMDAVRSNRVVEDFSDRWSYAREDFERKLYRKRNKTAVKFVELTDTIPVQGPDTELEVTNRLVFADFMALLDAKERQVVILLSSGYTKLTDIAGAMGYANHSPISKKLAKIRKQAEAFFDGQ
jgi:hypothetical protein